MINPPTTPLPVIYLHSAKLQTHTDLPPYTPKPTSNPPVTPPYPPPDTSFPPSPKASVHVSDAPAAACRERSNNAEGTNEQSQPHQQEDGFATLTSRRGTRNTRGPPHTANITKYRSLGSIFIYRKLSP